MDASLAAYGGDFDSRSGTEFRMQASQQLAAAGSRPATFLDVAGMRDSAADKTAAGPVRSPPATVHAVAELSSFPQPYGVLHCDLRQQLHIRTTCACSSACGSFAPRRRSDFPQRESARLSSFITQTHQRSLRPFAPVQTSFKGLMSLLSGNKPGGSSASLARAPSALGLAAKGAAAAAAAASAAAAADAEPSAALPRAVSAEGVQRGPLDEPQPEAGAREDPSPSFEARGVKSPKPSLLSPVPSFCSLPYVLCVCIPIAGP